MIVKKKKTDNNRFMKLKKNEDNKEKWKAKEKTIKGKHIFKLC